MIKNGFKIHALSLFLLASGLAQAKTFRTQFIRLEIPPNWECNQEELDWVCRPDNLSEQSEVLLVVVVKPMNEIDDTFDKYRAILSEPRAMRDLLGNEYKSEVKYVKDKTINTRVWIDSLQFGSEIQGFYTRYTATIHEKIAALITYSIAESVYAKWSNLLDGVINSAEVFFDPKAFSEVMQQRPSSLLGSRNSLKGRLAPTTEEDPNQKKGGGFDPSLLVGALIIAGAAGFLIWKKKQQKK